MQIPTKTKRFLRFSETLLKWNKEKNKRQMPWKGEKDPFKIWLSEIILQQTRVEQGIKYYTNFIKAFPDVHKLAKAPDQKVYKLWEGLGYYTRCRNLIGTARYISRDLKGKFPSHYEQIKNLKGVGPYTAAAISSFAFDEPRAVVDGNVFRVLARIFKIDTAIDSTEGKKFFTRFANELLDKGQPGLYNQAIMDFGATICKPVPACEQCPFIKYCKALQAGKIFSLPVKGKKIAIKKRWFNYIVFEYKGRFAIRQRIEKDIWYHLFEFLLIESNSILGKKKIVKELQVKGWPGKNNFEKISFSSVFRQKLSHQLIEGRFAIIKLRQKPKLTDVIWVKKNEMVNYAFPKFINQYLFNENRTGKDGL
ncbi:MAG: A/G-specific adenine glycosylase [Chitinophagales bacterium]